MKIALLIHSKTGNTLSVADKLCASLAAAGHEAEILRVSAENEDEAAKGNVTLFPVPDISGFDGYVFAAPVWGFNLSPVMKQYLTGIPDLDGKKSACFVTHQFSKAFLGGNHSVRQLNSALSAKGAEIAASGVINWSAKDREAEITALVGQITKVF